MELLPDKLVPNTRNRWVMRIPGIDAFLTKAVQLPTLSACDADEHATLVVAFHNAIGCPINSPLLNMMRAGKVFDAELVLLDKAGTVTDKWSFKHAMVNQIYFDGLDYGEQGPMTTYAVICFPQQHLCIERES